LSSPQVVLLKNYLKIADASDVELQGCLEVSRRYKLDPFKQGQIWFVKRWDKSAVAVNGTKGAYVYTPQVGIYGMLHIAARDHKDFGSISDAEFGPMFMHDVEGKKIKAPEWCRVKAYKKGIEQPTVATIYFEEFCPALWDNARLFWARMPRAQLEKCCKARVVRTAYPDLGGLFIPEEMDRMNEEVTAGGRRITYRDDQTLTPEAKEAIEGLKAKGLWCDDHQCTRSTAHLEVCESSRKAMERHKEPPIDPPAAPVPHPAPSGKPPAKGGKIPESEYRKENVPPPTKAEQWKFAGSVTFDYTEDKTFPQITGSIADLIPHFPKDLSLKRKEDFWHAFSEDAERIKQICVKLNYEIVEILPQKPSGGPPKQRHDSPPEHPTPKGGRGVSTPAPAGVVSCTIERVNTGMAGKSPVKHVTVLLSDRTKPTYSCFDKKWFERLDAGLGKFARLLTKQNGKYTNIIGALMIGSKEWLEDGTPVIQNKDREAGGKTLF
jgi:hypothetical protein